MINLRLNKHCVQDLIEFSQTDGLYTLTEDVATIYCSGAEPTEDSVQTYGAYYKGTKLVSVMTASFLRVFPHPDSPSGKIVHISGAYTLPAYRHQGNAIALLKAIERDAVDYGADYLCCDNTANEFYKRAGFVPFPQDKTKMWKQMTLPRV